MKIKQAIQALAVGLPLAFLLYFWTASLILFAGKAEAVSSWNVNATVNVTNAPPTVVSVLLDDNVTSPADTIDLVAGGTQLVYCNATVNDTNGYLDITSARAVLYHSSSTPNAADNNETHYTNNSCTLLAGSGISRPVSCAFNMLYYATNGTWTCNVTAFDSDNANGTGIDTANVSILVALNISTQVLNYGNLAPLQESSPVTETITNHGNVQIDLVLNGTDMPCTSVGIITPNAQHYNVTGTGTTYATMTPLQYNPVTETSFNLAKRTDAAESTRATYWKIIPPVGTKGICTGNVTIAAVVG
ncbi:MAG: hypothetical protein QXW00_04155 [Candidatus Woesearchaeota archaeon]